jgi:hypothetical protein
MKIRTIVGVMLVLALVLGSTGIGAADQNDCDGDRDRDCWVDGEPPGVGSCNVDCEPDCDGPNCKCQMD